MTKTRFTYLNVKAWVISDKKKYNHTSLLVVISWRQSEKAKPCTVSAFACGFLVASLVTDVSCMSHALTGTHSLRNGHLVDDSVAVLWLPSSVLCDTSRNDFNSGLLSLTALWTILSWVPCFHCNESKSHYFLCHDWSCSVLILLLYNWYLNKEQSPLKPLFMCSLAWRIPREIGFYQPLPSCARLCTTDNVLVL